MAIDEHLAKPDPNNAAPMLWEQIRIVGSLPSLQYTNHTNHNLSGNLPVLFRDSELPEGIVIDDADKEPSLRDFVRCDLEPEDVDMSKAHVNALIRVQREDGTAF